MSVHLDSDLLRTFVAIADSGNFTRAADEIGRSQSAVSVQVRRLEEMIGEPLFVRGSRGVELTDRGDQLLGNARRIVALMDETAASLQVEPLGGHVRVGIPEDYARSVLPYALGKFAKTYPDVEVSIKIAPSSELAAAIDARKMDLAIAFAKPEEQDVDSLVIDPTVWVTSPLHCVHEHDPVPIAIYQRGWCRDFTISSLEERNVDYRIAYVCDVDSGLEAAVKSGLAIAPFSRSCIPPGCRELGEADGFGPIGFPRVVLLKSKVGFTRAAKAMEEVVRSAFSSLAIAA